MVFSSKPRFLITNLNFIKNCGSTAKDILLKRIKLWLKLGGILGDRIQKKIFSANVVFLKHELCQILGYQTTKGLERSPKESFSLISISL